MQKMIIIFSVLRIIHLFELLHCIPRIPSEQKSNWPFGVPSAAITRLIRGTLANRKAGLAKISGVPAIIGCTFGAHGANVSGGTLITRGYVSQGAFSLTTFPQVVITCIQLVPNSLGLV